MCKTSDKDDLPLTDKEIDHLFDEVQAKIDAESPEEKAKRKREWEAWLAREPELATAVSGLQKIFGQPEGSSDVDVNEIKYWVPSGIPEHLRIALSIPGEQPDTPMSHSGRLEGLLARLARKHEEECGEGSALQAALGIAPDANLRYADSDIKPDIVVELLMESDHLQLGWVHQIESGNHDQELQVACHEWGFVDRLSALVRLP